MDYSHSWNTVFSRRELPIKYFLIWYPTNLRYLDKAPRKTQVFCGIMTPHNRGVFMLIKDNVTIGIEWRFGPDWPGQRCGATTRRGAACQRPANKKNGRCRLHGGASTGARTEEGLARISAANLRHGKFTKDKLEKRRGNAAKGREILAELRQMERELIAGGLLDKHWRDSFPS